MIITRIQYSDLNELKCLYDELTQCTTDYDKMRVNYKLMQKNTHYYLLGARTDKKLVGSLMGILCLDLVGECKPFMLIENVIVSAPYRSKGIGKTLFTEIESIARSNNCYYIILVSSAHRIAAHAFYESIGYCDEKANGFKKILT